MRKNCKTFDQWIDSMTDEFFATTHKSTYLRHTITYTEKSAICIITNEKTGKTSSYSVRLDHFSCPNLVATAFAWAKYNHEYIFDNDHTELPTTNGMYNPEYERGNTHD